MTNKELTPEEGTIYIYRNEDGTQAVTIGRIGELTYATYNGKEMKPEQLKRSIEFASYRVSSSMRYTEEHGEEVPQQFYRDPVEPEHLQAKYPVVDEVNQEKFEGATQ